MSTKQLELPGFAVRDPQRWRTELDALTAAGLQHRLVNGDETVGLEVTWPATTHTNGSEPRASLLVLFPAAYPYFPPAVFDPHDKLQVRRHRSREGELCLTRPQDWNPKCTLAELLDTQVPRLLEASAQTPPGPGVEVTSPEPISSLLSTPTSITSLVIPESTVPATPGQGALIARLLSVDSVPDGGGAALVEHLYAANAEHHRLLPPPEHESHSWLYGRWTHDPAFNPRDSAATTWHRITRDLADLEVATETHLLRPGEPTPVDPHYVELLCLRVPSETRYRHRGEEWIAITRYSPRETDSRYAYVQVQNLTPDTYGLRNGGDLPESWVALVGVGAIGSQIARHLIGAGLRRLDLIDGDHVDIGAATRQHAPLTAAGQHKASALAAHLRTLRPDVDIRDHVHYLGRPTTRATRQCENDVSKTLIHADLVIDAAASHTVTRYLAALRHHQSSGFIHVSATAGAWGGVIFQDIPASDPSACWTCLEYHRHAHTVPVPTADPDGVVAPVGCFEPTFTGTSADLAGISAHTARLALAHLAGEPFDDNLHIAHLRDHAGTPTVLRWETTAVAVHPDCPNHHATSRAATAQTPRTRHGASTSHHGCAP